MKLYEIVIAQPAIQKLILQDLPLRKAWELAQLINAINPQLEFYTAERMKLEPLKSAESVKKLDQLHELDFPELDSVGVVTLPLDADLKLSAADLKRMERFVRFEEVSTP